LNASEVVPLARPNQLRDDQPCQEPGKSGVVLTVGDLKAILFDASFFPSLFHLRVLSSFGIGLIATMSHGILKA
jgi:hypothetical protein